MNLKEIFKNIGLITVKQKEIYDAVDGTFLNNIKFLFKKDSVIIINKTDNVDFFKDVLNFINNHKKGRGVIDNSNSNIETLIELNNIVDKLASNDFHSGNFDDKDGSIYDSFSNIKYEINSSLDELSESIETIKRFMKNVEDVTN